MGTETSAAPMSEKMNQNTNQAITQETIHSVAAPAQHYTLLLAADGNLIRIDADGTLTASHNADDAAMWVPVETGFRHAVSGELLDADNSAELLSFSRDGVSFIGVTTTQGPGDLPSHSLTHFREHGWVCLPAILDDNTLEGLEKISGSERYAAGSIDSHTSPICQHPAVARMAAEPVSLWLMRQYMGTDNMRSGHPPSFAILEQDDGARDVQGWHSDFPYMWGFEGTPPYGRIPNGSGSAVLGVQRNVCISPFTRESGATAFKLGSSRQDHGPPTEWGLGSLYGQPGHRAEFGLPYCGPEADVVETPAGSIILYDSRTWHRAGVNALPKRRAAMLQAMIPGFMMPFFDCSEVFHQFLEQPFLAELSKRELFEIQRLMINHMEVGPHRIAIRPDPVLSNLLKRGR